MSNYFITDDRPDLKADDNSRGAKVARNTRIRNTAMDAAVKAIGERDRARRPGYDPVVTIRRVEPWSLKDRPL